MRYRRSFLFISIILAFVLVWGICYSFAKEGVREFTLDNGLKVILEENRSTPVVALQIWVNVGSGDERDEEAGMCHFIEHKEIQKVTKEDVHRVAQKYCNLEAYALAIIRPPAEKKE
jgi:predicted Zn-dependent peptidase